MRRSREFRWNTFGVGRREHARFAMHTRGGPRRAELSERVFADVDLSATKGLDTCITGDRPASDFSEAASFGIRLSANRKNRWLHAPATNLSRYINRYANCAATGSTLSLARSQRTVSKKARKTA